MKSQFQKTKLCTFFLEHRCKKRDRCLYAHGEAELQRPPDLRCTKMCPRIADGGECDREDCLYAHTPEDLRVVEVPTLPPMTKQAQESNELDKKTKEEPTEAVSSADKAAPQQGKKSNQDAQSTVGDDIDINSDLCDSSGAFLGSDWRRQLTEDPVALTLRVMRVKNTFITIDSDDESEQAQEPGLPSRKPHRSKSVPATFRLQPESCERRVRYGSAGEKQVAELASQRPPVSTVDQSCPPKAGRPATASRARAAVEKHKARALPEGGAVALDDAWRPLKPPRKATRRAAEEQKSGKGDLSADAQPFECGAQQEQLAAGGEVGWALPKDHGEGPESIWYGGAALQDFGGAAAYGCGGFAGDGLSPYLCDSFLGGMPFGPEPQSAHPSMWEQFLQPGFGDLALDPQTGLPAAAGAMAQAAAGIPPGAFAPAGEALPAARPAAATAMAYTAPPGPSLRLLQQLRPGPAESF